MDAASDGFGEVASVSGDTALVGAHFTDVAGRSSSDTAYMFEI